MNFFNFMNYDNYTNKSPFRKNEFCTNITKSFILNNGVQRGGVVIKRARYNFQDFYDRIENQAYNAISELKNGGKKSHWMWYFFPQLVRENTSEQSMYYGIQSLNEAKAFFEDQITGKLLRKMTYIVAELLKNKHTITFIFGKTDAQKFLSCMTLFDYATRENKDYNAIFRYCRKKAENELQIVDQVTIDFCKPSV